MDVSEIFNELSYNYDDISDLWYAWLFSRIHYIIAKEVINKFQPKEVLDIGCGTGFQSFLHSASGARVVGVDIAKRLLEVAMKKSISFKNQKELNLFSAEFPFVKKYNILINSILKDKIQGKEYIPPCFRVADVIDLPFEDNSFDHINCCGSTLSFIEKHHLALLEIKRVLKPGGTFFCEIESRWNNDLFWGFLDAIIKGRIGYRMSFIDALKSIIEPPNKYILINYPLRDSENPIILNLRLFTKWGLKKELRQLQFKILKKWTIHSITNLVPSTYLDKAKLSNWIKFIFNFLAKIEENLPISLPGCSMVFLARLGKKTG